MAYSFWKVSYTMANISQLSTNDDRDAAGVWLAALIKASQVSELKRSAWWQWVLPGLVVLSGLAIGGSYWLFEREIAIATTMASNRPATERSTSGMPDHTVPQAAGLQASSDIKPVAMPTTASVPTASPPDYGAGLQPIIDQLLSDTPTPLGTPSAKPLEALEPVPQSVSEPPPSPAPPPKLTRKAQTVPRYEPK